jgi:hypothetical protein
MPHFMRPIDRVHAERQLIDAFDEQMNWADVHLFFKRMRIPRPDFGDDSYTLKELVRGYIAECSDEGLLDIAQQLGLDVAPAKHNDGLVALGDSKYWLIDHLRVFISHVHTAKVQAGALRYSLQRYAITGFVAHATPDFNGSKWTDQEIGVAVARGVLMIPIDRGAKPYGFLEKYQALPSKGLLAGDVAAEVFRTICANAHTKGRMIDSLTRTISTGSDVSELLFRINKLYGIEGVGVEDWERIRENVAGNNVLSSSRPVLDRLNLILLEKKLEPIEIGGPKSKSLDDEIPF